MDGHTPGPWRWETPRGHDEDWYEGPLMKLLGPGDATVCDFGNCTQYYPTQGQEPSDADARLIAAAPSLLGACRRALAELNGTKEKCDGPLGTIITLERVINLAEGNV